MPVISIKAFRDHLNTNIQIWMARSAAVLFSIFGTLALTLAVVGTYGVIAYSVTRRTREIGIRMALGAPPQAVKWMILREGGLMLVTGIVGGLALTTGIGQVVRTLLYQANAADPWAFSVAPALLSVATLLASWIPARRATRTDPMAALRAE